MDVRNIALRIVVVVFRIEFHAIVGARRAVPYRLYSQLSAELSSKGYSSLLVPFEEIAQMLAEKAVARPASTEPCDVLLVRPGITRNPGIGKEEASTGAGTL